MAEATPYHLTDEQRALRSGEAEFVDSKITPNAAQWDIDKKLPESILRECGEMGFAGVMVLEELGGAGMSTMDYALIVEEVSRGCASTGVAISVNNSLVLDPLCRFGTAEQQRKYVPALASGESYGCFGLTEPAAGSDAGRQQTTYEDKGDHFLINGRKNFITNGGEADICIVMASKDPALGNKGLAAFIVETSWDGFQVEGLEDKMGICASSTASLSFDNLKVPKENLLGEEGQGFKIAMITLDGGRIGVAAQAVGIAQAALDASKLYISERAQFGRTLDKFQGTRWKIADMAMQIEAARLLVWKASSLKDFGRPYSLAAAQAKLFASEVSSKVSRQAVQLHGGYGFMQEYAIGEMWADARVQRIYGGTNEIMKELIARAL